MKKVVVFSGAGLSKESGIPTFRDSVSGLWENYRVEDVASSDGWRKNPDVVLRFYEDRMKNIGSCLPNAAHLALAKLEQKYEVTHATQNIDDLLERAGCSKVVHLHGDILHRKCEKHSSISMLEGDGGFSCNYRAPQTEAVKLGDSCPSCGGRLRPDIVWFGEPVHKMESVESLTPDIFIVVGTSAVVHPAASLIYTFRTCGVGNLFFIDPVDSPRLQSYDRRIGPASVEVPKLVEELLAKP